MEKDDGRLSIIQSEEANVKKKKICLKVQLFLFWNKLSEES